MIAWVQSTQARRRRVRRRRQPRRVRDRPRHRQAGGGRRRSRSGRSASTGKTDDKGLATLALGARAIKGAHYLVARARRRRRVRRRRRRLVERVRQLGQAARGTTQLAWYVIDDRKMYKPGEEVSLKGWLRTIDYGKNGDVGGSAARSTRVDVQGHRLARQRDREGLGDASARSAASTRSSRCRRRRTSATRTSQFETQGRLQRRVRARLPDRGVPPARVRGQRAGEPGAVPRRRQRRRHGRARSTTRAARCPARRSTGTSPRARRASRRRTATTTRSAAGSRGGAIAASYDDDGARRLQAAEDVDARRARPTRPARTSLHLDFLSVKPAMPMSVTANASVTDVNRQTWSASAALIVHPSSLYVGLKTKKPFVEKGTPFDLDVIGVDLDGKAAPGAKIEVKAVRLDWEYKKGKYTQKEVDPQTCAVIAAADAVPCSVRDEGGRHVPGRPRRSSTPRAARTRRS